MGAFSKRFSNEKKTMIDAVATGSMLEPTAFSLVR